MFLIFFLCVVRAYPKEEEIKFWERSRSYCGYEKKIEFGHFQWLVNDFGFLVDISLKVMNV